MNIKTNFDKWEQILKQTQLLVGLVSSVYLSRMNQLSLSVSVFSEYVSDHNFKSNFKGNTVNMTCMLVYKLCFHF